MRGEIPSRQLVIPDVEAPPRSLPGSPRGNWRFLVAVVVAFAGFFFVDWYLFAHEGFLRLAGEATQEGQVLSKVARASRQAEIADVVLFGSSYVRSGVAGEPFLERGLLPFNFAVSGGGPVYDYFALKRIAPILAQRRDKPVLLIELKSDVLVRTRGSAWSEYPQYISIVRSRREMLEYAPQLWENFRGFGMTSQFLSGMLIPSSIYRSHVVGLLGGRGSLDGYFYGSEDFSGFSPLYTRAVPSMSPPGTAAPVPIDDLYPGKVEFIRAFLALARTTGCPVVLYESPTVFLGRDSAMLDPLVAQMRREFSDLRVIRTSDYRLDIGDFDEGGHPNIAGSDEMSRYLIAALGLRGSTERLGQKIRSGFEMAVIPDLATWTGVGARAVGAGNDLVVRPLVAPTPLAVQSPPIRVSRGRDWVLELSMPESQGRLQFTLSWTDPLTHAEQSSVLVTPLEASLLGASARFFIRARPTADDVIVRVFDFNAQVQQPPTAARVKILRLWTNQ